MSAVAVQSAPIGLHAPFQPRHSAAPPASLTASVSRRPGIITLSKPIQRTPPRPRKATPSAPVPAPNATPKSEKARKPRSRPTSDEDDQESPKTRGRRNQDKTPSPKPRRNTSRTRQTPSPESEPVLQKPSGRLARQRKGTKSTPALCAAVSGSAPVPVPQVSSAPSSGLSRSAPLATPAMSQSLPARMRRTLTGPRDDPASKDVPPSPSPRRVRESKGPLTAPLGGVFPRPTHNRSPSEALFNLSLDETDDEPQDMPILFGRRGGDKVYAGGRFQNGPDTTTLPAPSFLSGF